MSSVERASRVLKSLTDEEWRTLGALERTAKSTGIGDTRMLSRLSGLPGDRTRFAVNQLERKGLAMRRGLGYTLRSEAVEVMALREYVKKDLIYAIGAIIAKGKESDVYEAVNEEGSLFALKFFKLGRRSFTQVRKKRFTEDDMKSWINVNFEAANREYSALKRLAPLGPQFPKVVASNRSTVLMEHLSGVRLVQRPELAAPGEMLAMILEAVRVAFLRGGLVNADLSEYNVLTDGSNAWLIDWPQSVGVGHPNHMELLRHDVVTVVRFFRRAYRVESSEDSAFKYASGASKKLE